MDTDILVRYFPDKLIHHRQLAAVRLTEAWAALSVLSWPRALSALHLAGIAIDEVEPFRNLSRPAGRAAPNVNGNVN